MISAKLEKQLCGVTITYSLEAYQKCALWVKNAISKSGNAVEIGWEGKVRVRKNANGPGMHDYFIEDVYLWPDQTGGHGTVGGTSEGQAALAEWYVAHGIERGEVLHWGHSHADGEVFQSSVDLDNVECVYGWGPKNARTPAPAAPFCVAVTWNTHMEQYGEITYFAPCHFRVTDVPVSWEIPDTGIKDAALAELAAKFTPEVWQPAERPEYHGNGYWGPRDSEGSVSEFFRREQERTALSGQTPTLDAVIGNGEHIGANVAKMNDAQVREMIRRDFAGWWFRIDGKKYEISETGVVFCWFEKKGGKKSKGYRESSIRVLRQGLVIMLKEFHKKDVHKGLVEVG